NPYTTYMFQTLPALLFTLSFFFTATATTEIYTLSLHDALPISRPHRAHAHVRVCPCARAGGRTLAPRAEDHRRRGAARRTGLRRSEEHTSELQSRGHLVCRLLLEKKKTIPQTRRTTPAR